MLLFHPFPYIALTVLWVYSGDSPVSLVPGLQACPWHHMGNLIQISWGQPVQEALCRLEVVISK